MGRRIRLRRLASDTDGAAAAADPEILAWVNAWADECEARDTRQRREVVERERRKVAARWEAERRLRARRRSGSLSGVDDRDRSVSLRAWSGGLPTLGKRR